MVQLINSHRKKCLMARESFHQIFIKRGKKLTKVGAAWPILALNYVASLLCP